MIQLDFDSEEAADVALMGSFDFLLGWGCRVVVFGCLS